VRLSDKDLLFGHTTFSDFSEMTRIFKFYDMPLPGAAAKKIMFSSYPGVAGSTDDYYVTDSGLAVTETTISMLTDEVYDVINDTPKKQEIPDYMRILLSTRVATSGKHWIDLMRDSATGLYSSQWMVVDSNKIQKSKDSIKLNPGAFYVLDQIPGTQHSADMTETLKKNGYWGSQNRAWFDDVRDHMGASQAEEMDGRVFSKDKSPRAVIFKATAGSVENLEEMKQEMQRNRWPHEIDGGDKNTPDHAIAARSDLGGFNVPNGAVDSKVSSLDMIRLMQVDAISGPTTDNGRVAPFRWTDARTGRDLYPDYPHEGMPDVYNFGWVEMKEEA